MIQQNLHTHTVWDDGQNTPEEMAIAAIKAGLTSLGFSIHSYLDFAEDWTLSPEKLPAYCRAIQALKEAYQDKLTVYHGIEWDILSESNLPDYDYVIGSIHQVELHGELFCVDASPETTSAAKNRRQAAASPTFSTPRGAKERSRSRNSAVDTARKKPSCMGD